VKGTSTKPAVKGPGGLMSGPNNDQTEGPQEGKRQHQAARQEAPSRAAWSAPHSQPSSLRQRVIIYIIQVMYHSNHYKSAALLVPIGWWSQLLVGLLRLGPCAGREATSRNRYIFDAVIIDTDLLTYIFNSEIIWSRPRYERSSVVCCTSVEYGLRQGTSLQPCISAVSGSEAEARRC
jgi:hypothetical protein